MATLTDIERILMDPAVVHTARYGIAALFAFAAISKARNYSVFRATMLDYQLVPKHLLGICAALVFALELFISCSVFHSALAPLGMQLAAVLLLAYGSAIGTNLLRGRRDIDCGCTGPAVRQSLTGWLVLRNIVLTMIALVGMSVPIQRTLSGVDFILIAVTLGAAFAIYAAANQLMANIPRLDSLDSLMEAN